MLGIVCLLLWAKCLMLSLIFSQVSVLTDFFKYKNVRMISLIDAILIFETLKATDFFENTRILLNCYSHFPRFVLKIHLSLLGSINVSPKFVFCQKSGGADVMEVTKTKGICLIGPLDTILRITRGPELLFLVSKLLIL